MIAIDKERRVFTLHTKNTTYQMKADQYGVLLHTYYGPRVGEEDLSRLIQYVDRGFSPTQTRSFPGGTIHWISCHRNTPPAELETTVCPLPG